MKEISKLINLKALTKSANDGNKSGNEVNPAYCEGFDSKSSYFAEKSWCFSNSTIYGEYSQDLGSKFTL
jgi:hypothetical protein